MRALLDVNVLVALLDAAHLHHSTARQWLTEHEADGWASCPLTQNGTVRILSTASYPNSIATSEATTRLSGACSNVRHEFWADDVSILDVTRVRQDRIHGPRQITDLYLLALAVAHGGRLVTLDTAIPITPVVGATKRHLVVL